MRMDKLTSKFQLALADAQSLALGRDHAMIEPAHLLSAMLDQDGGGIRPLLQSAGVSLAGLRSALSEKLEQLPSVSGGQDNEASGSNSSVSGGLSRSATGFYDWRAGTLFEDF